ncbi:MAG: GNAT family N-acetyltransferase [Dehalococcoidia bacterium]|nr:GNAT family N-acetyltransferase [Dehalococcoidia bacterium]
MKIDLRSPSRSDRQLLRRMMELYLYDFSEYEDLDLDAHGLYGYGDLDYFWFESTHAAFIITVDAKLVGFVLVDNEVHIAGSERSISEFFVMRKYRRLGVGKHAAFEVFRRLPAAWEVRVVASNEPAQRFWRTIIGEFMHGRFQETHLDSDEWNGPTFTFNNSEADAT